MSFQNDDLFLVNRGGNSFKTEYGLLKTNINEDAGVIVSDTPPDNANEGDLWYNSDDKKLYVWYVNETTGVVTSVTVRNGGSGYTVDANDVETDGGGGSGLTVDIQAGVGGNFANPAVNSGGHAYEIGDVAFLIGAGHANGSVTITAVNTVAVGQWVEAGGSGTYNGAAAWADTNAAGTLANSFNIDKVDRSSDGVFDYKFIKEMPSDKYAIVATVHAGGSASDRIISTANKTTTGFSVIINNTGSMAPANNNHSVVVHANNALPPIGGTGADGWADTGETGAVNNSFNLTCEKTIKGVYKYTFDQKMPTANYAVLVSPTTSGARYVGAFEKTTTGFEVHTYNTASAYVDQAHMVAVHASNATLPKTITEEQLEAFSKNGVAAWGRNGGSGSGLLNSLNIAGVDNSTEGVFVYTFSTPMPSANYAVTASLDGSNGLQSGIQVSSQLTTGFTIRTYSSSGNPQTRPHGFAVFATNATPPKGGTGADAWAKTQSAGVLQNGFNIKSVTWNTATSQYDYVFNTPMPNATYSVSATPAFSPSSQRTAVLANPTTTGFSIALQNTDVGGLTQASHSVVVHATNATLPSTITMADYEDLVARVTALEGGS